MSITRPSAAPGNFNNPPEMPPHESRFNRSAALKTVGIVGAAALTGAVLHFGFGVGNNDKELPRDVPSTSAPANPSVEYTPDPVASETEAPLSPQEQLIKDIEVPVVPIENDQTGSIEVEKATKKINKGLNSWLNSNDPTPYEEALTNGNEIFIKQLYFAKEQGKLVEGDDFSLGFKADINSTLPTADRTEASVTLDVDLVVKYGGKTYTDGSDSSNLSGEATWIMSIKKDDDHWVITDLSTLDQ